MQVFFKMIIDDGEKYYAGEDPGIAICDYVYMRGLNGIDDNTFWENQRKHYREHMQFVFTFIPNPRSTLVDVAEEIVKRIELDPQKFIEFRVPIYILENLELVEIEDPTIPLSTISKYYDISKALHIFFVLSNQAGDIWVEDGLRYYMHSKEAGRHNLPHIHVDYKHECSATISLYDGKMVDGDMPRRVMKRASKKIMDNQRYLMECWNKLFYPQLGVKLCSMAGGGVQKIYMVFLREPSRRDRSGSDLFHLWDGFEIKMNFDRNVSCFIFVNALMHDDFFD